MFKRQKEIVASALAGVMILSSSVSVFSNSFYEGKVDPYFLNVRESGNLSSSVVGIVQRGDSLEVLTSDFDEGDFVEVRNSDVEGYVNSRYLDLTETDNTELIKIGMVSLSSDSSRLNFRDGPGTSYSSKNTLTNGEEFSVIDTEGSWYEVKLNSGEAGFIHRDFTKITDEISGGDENESDSQDSSNMVIHEVVTGDTLWLVSKDYDITVSDIQKWNDLESNMIFSGDELIVSEPSGSIKGEKEDKGEQEDEGKTKKVVVSLSSASALNVRDEAGMSGSIIDTLSDEEEVQKIGEDGNWIEVKLDDHDKAYVFSQYVKEYDNNNQKEEGSSNEKDKSDEEKEELIKKTVNLTSSTSTLNVRKGPGMSYDVSDRLENGHEIEKTGREGNWIQFKKDDEVRYAFGEYLLKSENDEQEEKDENEYEGSQNDKETELIKLTHTVSHGEYLYKIASLYDGVSVSDIQEWNDLESNILFTDQELEIHFEGDPLENYSVVVDPGHGGNDSGAIREGVNESEINLDISILLEEKLTEYGADVHMTREDDSTVPSNTRYELAEDTESDIFISIHANASRNVDARGGETYYRYKSRDYELANSVHEHMINNSDFSDRGVKYGNFYMLRNNTVPSVLVEAGFMSNPDELQKLLDTEYQEKIAKGIAEGVIDYRN